MTRRVMEVILGAEGFECSAVASVDEAAQLLHEADFDLMLLDCFTPDFRAPELLELARLRQPDLPTVCVTSATDREVAARCLAVGARSVLLKPVGEGVLRWVARGFTQPPVEPTEVRAALARTVAELQEQPDSSRALELAELAQARGWFRIEAVARALAAGLETENAAALLDWLVDEAG